MNIHIPNTPSPLITPATSPCIGIGNPSIGSPSVALTPCDLQRQRANIHKCIGIVKDSRGLPMIAYSVLENGFVHTSGIEYDGQLRDATVQVDANYTFWTDRCDFDAMFSYFRDALIQYEQTEPELAMKRVITEYTSIRRLFN